MHVESASADACGVPGDDVFPVVLRCLDEDATACDVEGWVRAELEALEAALRQHGALLFRGFPCASAADFDAFVCSFGYANFPYDESLSNAVRVNLSERVFTANEAPSSAQIGLHHEMAQTPSWPEKLFFFCEHPAERGGATSLARSDLLFAELERSAPAFARDCAEKGLRYHSVMPARDDASSGQGRSWRSTFGVESRAAAEERLDRLGYAWQWSEDGSLLATSPVLPAVYETATRRRSFFNQLIAARTWDAHAGAGAGAPVSFGDGSPVPADQIRHAAALADRFTVDLDWQRGDVALIDNTTVMHGRRSFEGRRRVLASLVAASA